MSSTPVRAHPDDCDDAFEDIFVKRVDKLVLGSQAFAIIAQLERLGALENGEMIELHLDEAASARQSLRHAF